MKAGAVIFSCLCSERFSEADALRIASHRVDLETVHGEQICGGMIKWEPRYSPSWSLLPHVSGLWGTLSANPARNAITNSCLRSDMEAAPSGNSDFGKYSPRHVTLFRWHSPSNELDQRELSSTLLFCFIFYDNTLLCSPSVSQPMHKTIPTCPVSATAEHLKIQENLCMEGKED